MESSSGCSGVIRILLRCSEAPSPCPQGIWRPFNTGKGKKGRNCVCVCVCVCVRACARVPGEQGGELISQKSPTPSRRKLAEWAEKGDGRRGKDVELGSGSGKISALWRAAEISWHVYRPPPRGHNLPHAEAPRVGSRLGLRSADWRGWKVCM